MKVASLQVALCSTCGTTLNGNGECLACLVRLGFDYRLEESPLPVFGDYEVARREDGSLWELGHGAMGVTYRAEDKVLNRTVALKVVTAPAALGISHAVRDRFLREARAAAAFRHPNVAGVFSFGASSEGDRCYYAMELVEGKTLEALVRRDGPLKVETALEMAVQVTRALVAAAAHGLVHRDLKPGNIMLTRAGAATQDLEVKVIDFGLAKSIGSGNEIDLTHGAFVGTPAFASPEQFSRAPADARSDIYSLGATLWYALTGEVPYEGKTIEAIRRSQTELALPLRKLFARKVPRPVIQLLRRILAVDPTKRPASARELMGALEACRARLGYTRPSWWRTWPIHYKLIGLAGLLAMGAAVFFTFRLSGQKAADPILAPAKSIAVLPFENLSDDKQNAYFADGVQEEILTTLAKIADLKVISRTSVMQFRNAEKRSLRNIAQQLGVAHVLEGSVQRSTNRVRVTAQLIDTRTDSHVWADQYDGELADVFAIQSEIAQKIAGQLKAALSPHEQVALQTKPTADTAAYDLYLRAKEIWHEDGYNSVEKQVTLLDQAVARDPDFVAALRRLVEVHLANYAGNSDHTPARLALARKALDRAALLQPEAGEVHLSRAIFHYWGNRDYTAALAELALAGRSLPNDTDVLFFKALVERRLGRWEDSIRSIKRALVLDPRGTNLAYILADNYFSLRRYDEARREVQKVLEWKPDNFLFRCFEAEFDLHQHADLSRLQKVFSDVPATEDQIIVALNRRRIAFLGRDYRAAEKALAEYPLPDFSSWTQITPREYYEGLIARALGEAPRAESAFLRARERAAARVSDEPDEASALIMLAKINAALGRKEEALSAGERAVKLRSVAKDAYDGPAFLELLAEVYAEAGELGRALDVLEEGVGLPNGPSYGRLQLEEAFDPLRKDPRFLKLLASLAPKSGR